MKDSGPEFTFHGLPLSTEQESEIRHYIHQRLRRGMKPDGDELRSMIRDMLEPPVDESLLERVEADGAHADAERAAGQADNGGDPITAREERTAAREAEAMKRQGA
jgi:hypothetical protein